MQFYKRPMKQVCCVRLQKRLAGVTSTYNHETSSWNEEEYYQHFYVRFGGPKRPLYSISPFENFPSPEQNSWCFFDYNNTDFLNLVKNELSKRYNSSEYELIVTEAFV